MAASLIAAAAVAAFAILTLLRARRRAVLAETAWPPEGEPLTLGGVRLHAVVRGSGPDVVLIHGAAGSVRDFTFALLPKLAERYRVIAIDRPGHGHSDRVAGADALSLQARLLRQATAVLGAGCPIVVGHSYGASVALRWALDAPGTLAGLVAVAPASHPWDTALPLYYRITSHPLLRYPANALIAAWAPQTAVDSVVADVFAPDPVPGGYLAHFGPSMSARLFPLIENARQRRALKAELAAMAPRYRSIAVPVEIVQGERDRTVGLDHHARALARDLPLSHLTVLPGHGHMPHHAAMEAVIRAVDRLAAEPPPDLPDREPPARPWVQMHRPARPPDAGR
ncbi:MAG: alpha/beta fold hydrolase [Paracoccaceae bacterium]